MNVLIILVLWIAICILTALLARVVIVKIADKNGYCADDMPMKYHAWAIGAYCTIIYPSLFILNMIF